MAYIERWRDPTSLSPIEAAQGKELVVVGGLPTKGFARHDFDPPQIAVGVQVGHRAVKMSRVFIRGFASDAHHVLALSIPFFHAPRGGVRPLRRAIVGLKKGRKEERKEGRKET